MKTCLLTLALAGALMFTPAKAAAQSVAMSGCNPAQQSCQPVCPPNSTNYAVGGGLALANAAAAAESIESYAYWSAALDWLAALLLF